VLNSLKRQFRQEDYIVFTARSGMAGLDILQGHDIGVVMSDYMMPEMDGISFLESVKQNRPDTVRVLLTAYSALDNAIVAINQAQIFGYLIKPWSPDVLKGTIARAFEHYNLVVENKRLFDLNKRQNQELKRCNGDLENLVHERTLQLEEAVREGIIMLALAAEAKDDDTGAHIYRIQNLTEQMCTGFGLSVKESEQIGFFSIMHDVGKIHIPDSILKKQGPLTNDEFVTIKSHSVAGEEILGNKLFYQTARQIARSHHERWDGNGYPDGLRGKSIPFAARVVTIADVFDALTHERPYKRAWPVEKALEEMERLSGEAFDPEILDVFLQFQGKGTTDDEIRWALNGT